MQFAKKRITMQFELMITLTMISQITIALTILIVWVFRFDNIVNEFRTYQLPDLVRNLVGAAKISLATLLIVSIWYPTFIIIPTLMMAFLMICAQVVHYRSKSSLQKRLPSAALFLLCTLVVYINWNNVT